MVVPGFIHSRYIEPALFDGAGLWQLPPDIMGHL
jgi:hypothetical protein